MDEETLHARSVLGGRRRRNGAWTTRAGVTMPNDFQEPVDEPTFSKVLAACKKRGVRVTVTVRNGALITCRIEMSGNAASIDFDLVRLGSNLSEEAQRRYSEKHDAYLKKHLKQLRPKKPG